MTFEYENHKFDIQTQLGMLQTSMHLAMSENPGVHIVGWKIESLPDNRKRLILYKIIPDGDPSVHPFPVPLFPMQITKIVSLWLSETDYGPEPDGAGSSEKGFHLYNEQWGFVANDWEAVAAVEPAWLYYGK